VRMISDGDMEELEELYWSAALASDIFRGLGLEIYPKSTHVLESISGLGSLADAKVVIVGQDPYINPGQAHGLAFSVPEGCPIPPSLRNIFKELNSDLGIPVPQSGYLIPWKAQKVVLLNRVLTVERGKSNSHSNIGWEEFTAKVIELIDKYTDGCVFLLWGRAAQKAESLIKNPKSFILKAAHPSPLSANKGFFGCRHFSKTNEYLESIGKEPINWSL
jgi:uracil-DNA glycosylase